MIEHEQLEGSGLGPEDPFDQGLSVMDTTPTIDPELVMEAGAVGFAALSPRKRTLTEKGLAFQVGLKTDLFIRQRKHLDVRICDIQHEINQASGDVEKLRELQYEVAGSLGELGTINEQVQSMQESLDLELEMQDADKEARIAMKHARYHMNRVLEEQETLTAVRAKQDADSQSQLVGLDRFPLGTGLLNAGVLVDSKGELVGIREDADGPVKGLRGEMRDNSSMVGKSASVVSSEHSASSKRSITWKQEAWVGVLSQLKK